MAASTPAALLRAICRGSRRDAVRESSHAARARAQSDAGAGAGGAGTSLDARVDDQASPRPRGCPAPGKRDTAAT